MTVAISRALLNPNISFKHAGLDSGMKYADFGAGALGHFVFPASEIVGEDGFVYAIDILQTVLSSIRSRAQDARIHVIKDLWGDIERECGVNIDPNSLDIISIVNVGRQLKQTSEPVHEAKRLLKTGGKLLVVGWKRDCAGIASEEEIVDPKRLETMAEHAGFKCIDRFEAGKYHWGVVFVSVS